ncbi:MAG: LiaF transmembrane domain-containing protein [Flavisolibacter sp.]
MNESFRNQMDERNERFKKRIEERWGHKKSGHGRLWTGLFLLVIGGLLLIKTAHILIFPSWFFTTPVLLIAIGVFIGLRHGFRGPVWFILILIGGILLADRIDPTMDLHRFMWPLILIGVGLVFILRPKRKRCQDWYDDTDNKDQLTGTEKESSTEYTKAGQENAQRNDFIDVTAVFGGVKKNILSKNFKGGDIVSFMGGSEIDLTQADFTGRIRMDVTNIFGGTKLIVPPTWDIENDITAIFGGVDDKRKIQGVNMDTNKVLVLDGTCMFGGIEIRSY